MGENPENQTQKHEHDFDEWEEIMKNQPVFAKQALDVVLNLIDDIIRRVKILSYGDVGFIDFCIRIIPQAGKLFVEHMGYLPIDDVRRLLNALMESRRESGFNWYEFMPNSIIPIITHDYVTRWDFALRLNDSIPEDEINKFIDELKAKASSHDERYGLREYCFEVKDVELEDMRFIWKQCILFDETDKREFTYYEKLVPY